MTPKTTVIGSTEALTSHQLAFDLHMQLSACGGCDGKVLGLLPVPRSKG